VDDYDGTEMLNIKISVTEYLHAGNNRLRHGRSLSGARGAKPPT